MAKNLVLLVGPPGSGKSTLAKQYVDEGYVYINQDLQGKEHLNLFNEAILSGKDVICDRLNFVKTQRDRYLVPAKKQEYQTKIIVLHESYETCFKRCKDRTDHLTIKDENSARSALNMFFSKYERVQDNEADQVERIWPKHAKTHAIIVDLDGTLCNVNHRLHHVRSDKKKNWGSFFKEMVNDTPNDWCFELVHKMSKDYQIVFCSGRPDSWKPHTIEWLTEHGIYPYEYKLYMRPRSDSRNDTIAKEIMLDFELLTRYNLFFFVDDRARVVDMYRSRGFTVLQCEKGDF
jgi:predicted kinase